MSDESMVAEPAPSVPARRLPVRLHAAALVILAWGSGLGIKVYDTMVVRQSGTSLISPYRLYEGVLPALRGRLLDRNGVPLAWSERRFCLVYTRPRDVERVWRDMHELARCLNLSPTQLATRVLNWPTSEVAIRNGLSAQEILALQNLLRDRGCFRVVSRFRRQQHPGSPRWRRQLGQTRQFGRREVGISGWERVYNQKLAGVDGKFEVLVDRDGNWVPGTWKERRKPRPGFDVYLPFAIDSAVVGLE